MSHTERVATPVSSSTSYPEVAEGKQHYNSKDARASVVSSPSTFFTDDVSQHDSPKSEAASHYDSWTAEHLLSTRFGRYCARKSGCPVEKHGRRGVDSDQRRTWTTTLLRFGPLSGIAMMCLSIGCLLSCLAILVASEDRATASWSVPPSTWIAAFTAISNLSMRYAAIQGAVIAWWIRASQGSTFARLHYDWRAGTTFRGALTSGRHMGFLGLACICSTLVVVDGPFLQRSTSVKLAPNTNTVKLDVRMAEEIPHNLTGNWGHALDYYSVWSGTNYAFNHSVPSATASDGSISNSILPTSSNWLNVYAIGQWNDNEPVIGSIRGCQDICHIKIRAPALATMGCESFTIPVDYHNKHNWSYFDSHNYWLAPPLTTDQFFIAPNLVITPDHEEINLVTGYATVDACKGVLDYSACTLRSAIGEYDVRIQDGQATLVSPETPTIIALANNTAPDYVWSKGQDGYLSTLAGVASAALNKWDAIFWVQTTADDALQPWGLGGPAGLTFQENTSSCASFSDPRGQVMASLNTLMFRIGSAAALHFDEAELQSRMDTGLSVKKTVVGTLGGDHTVFHSSYPFFVAAAVIQAVCLAIVAPTYWGWWKLGRPVSFSPLEIAKAFEAPLFDDINSNSSGRDIAKVRFNDQIRYGLTTTPSGKSKLAFTNPSDVKSIEGPLRFEV